MDSPPRLRVGLRVAVVLAMLQGPLPALANEGRGLWYITSSLAFHSTEDEVRNNATLTGDRRIDGTTEGDRRPGQSDTRDGSIEDGLSLSLNAGFGLTDRLSLQLDTGWFRSEVGPADGYMVDFFPISVNPLDPTTLAGFRNRTTSFAPMIGTITQIPVSVSLLHRFRKDRRLNPFLGAGVGMIFVELEADEDIEELNERLSNLRVREVYNELGEVIPVPGTGLSPDQIAALKRDARLPMRHLMTLQADDAFEWHLSGGLEYFLGGRSSFIASASYTFTDGAVEFLAADEDQVEFSIYPEPMFREDGSVKIFSDSGLPPNPYINPLVPAMGRYKCAVGTVGDFDNDGHYDDRCYRNNGLSARDDPDGRLLIQGGRIEYGGFTVNIGLRFYF
ncbi:MAG: hypothetical protein ACREAA_11290 [Candidatus Polarisedimenticolia bacterium]